MGSRTRRPAAAARLGATGLSVLGTVGLVAAMSSAASGADDDNAEASVDAPAATTAAVDPAQAAGDPARTVDEAAGSTNDPDETVVIELHRTVYVDEQGREVDPAAVVDTAVDPATPVSSVVSRTRRPRPTGGGSAAAPGTTAAASTSTTTPAPPPPPRCSGSECP